MSLSILGSKKIENQKSRQRVRSCPCFYGAQMNVFPLMKSALPLIDEEGEWVEINETDAT